MSEINQPVTEGLKTSPQKTTTQHSHTSGSDRKDDLGPETQVEANRDAMVVDEEVQVGIVSEGDSPNVEGADTTALGGVDTQDEELRRDDEEEKVEEPPVFDDADNDDDDEELDDQEEQP
ncbi:uncharacterized protein LOC127123680 [Lathyrus oleraceus]|uniref:uncharacterized protein LOC127123680 n=1 Tax=Pisum sativum TaxID=3888 RepID=UPI0021D08067|nr:uncharacterized protein LOC127123680 [Pisum sativum]